MTWVGVDLGASALQCITFTPTPELTPPRTCWQWRVWFEYMYFNNPNRSPNSYFVYDSLICQRQDLTCRVPLGSIIISFPSSTIVSANPKIQNPKKQGKADFMFIILLIISGYTAHSVDSFKSTFLPVRGFSIFSRRREYCPPVSRCF